MTKAKLVGLFLVSVMLWQTVNCQHSSSMVKSRRPVNSTWRAFPTIDASGLFGERVGLWRAKRLWYVENDPFLLAGFEARPGKHLWQGEHVGKWLHAAALTYEVTKEEKLKKALEQTVSRLLATQLSNGYLGTYTEEQRFYQLADAPTGWDIWTHRYNLYGLLAYEQFHPSQKVVEACKKMADLLINVYGKGRADMTKYGTRQGISSTTILESIVMLYERTGDKKYLDFAKQIVAQSEQNPGLRLMDAMLKKESVVGPGDGKAYQLMANLLGYLQLYQSTGEQKYLQTVLNGWSQIREKHLLVTGGPWTRKMPYNGNKECFARTDAFQPAEIVVENCCTVTWVQLNLHLSALTGEARYVEEAEKTMFNQFLGGQHADGIDWCYYTKPNEVKPPYVPTLHCCASSGPRALEMFSAHRVGAYDNGVSINQFSPAVIALPDEFGGGQLTISGNFPYNGTTRIMVETNEAKSFPLEFRLPYGTSLKEVKQNGKKTEIQRNKRGYYRLKNMVNKGDVIAVDLDYQLKLHAQEGEGGKIWIAFSYGPITLAQKITANPGEEPFVNSKLPVNKPEEILSMITPVDERNMHFAIKNTGIILVPYFHTGSRISGPRTYFEYTVTP
jgi:DUF1680 family protein